MQSLHARRRLPAAGRQEAAENNVRLGVVKEEKMKRVFRKE